LNKESANFLWEATRKMTVKPLFDKVVVESIEKEEKTTSGFILPTASQEKQQMARVVAVGPGGIIDGKEVTMQVKVGDKVLYAKYAGSEFKIDGKELTIIRQSDILAIVE
jgi:chaperonin GroES